MTWFNSNSTLDLEEFPILSYGPLRDLLDQDSCIYQSVLKLWPGSMVNISEEEILRSVTVALGQAKNDKGVWLDIAPLLSSIEYDTNGTVKSAKGLMINWLIRKSNSESLNWELEFINKVLNNSLPDGMKIYAVAGRSFEDALHRVMRNNMTVLFCGLVLIIVYVIAMIGRCNRVQQRIYLSLMGVSVTGLAIISAYGVCFYFGYSYGPIHPILPFLLLGIGVDDMFVIVQSVESLGNSEKTASLPRRIAKALEQSGMSVTVTSLTNVVAFGIGMTTAMPFLRSFCMFATMGILFLFIYEIMFFVSCLVLDERRLEENKDGCFCNRRVDFKPNECSQRNIQRQVFTRIIGPCLMRKKVKALVILITLIALSINIYGVLQLERNFNPLLYLNQDSYPIQYYDKLVEYYPDNGKRADIYLAGVDYYRDHDALVGLMSALRNNPYVNNRTLNSWFSKYEEWLDQRQHKIEDRDEYYGTLSEFLFMTQAGQGFVKDLKFDRLPFSDYNITTTKIGIQHVMINTTVDQENAMSSIRTILNNVNFSSDTVHKAVFSYDYVSWRANQIIGEELIRNLILEILAVGLVTMAVLRNLWVSFWVICCVLFTLIDLLGSMYYAGLTIEISSSIMILLCAGLAVDYAAHVGLEFTRARGSRNERAISTLGLIGPAVFNGGLSTFLAFVLLGASREYLFSTFFKLFTAVVVFGLFHGLLFLPVILSLLGSDEIEPAERQQQQHEEDKKIENKTWEANKYCTLPLPIPTSANEK